MEIDQARSLGNSTNDQVIKAGIPQLEKDIAGFQTMAKDHREKIKVTLKSKGFRFMNN